MSKLLEGYEAFLAGRTRKTVVDYTTVVRDFMGWLGKDSLTKVLVPSALEAYMEYLKGQGRTAGSQRKTLAILKGFCRWATQEGWLTRNPASHLTAPRVEAVSHALTSEQRRILKRLVEQADSRRLAAIFALGYWAGLRSSEVVGLRVGLCDITQRAGQITLLENEKPRTLELHARARAALYTYLYETPSTLPDARDPESLYVFTGQRAAWLRSQGRSDCLSVRGLEYLWAQTKAQASVKEWEQIQAIRFQDLRHDFVHRARQAGWSGEDITHYTGHPAQAGMPAVLRTARYLGREPFKARLLQLKG